ncbi:hypothetical protein ABN584_14935 [Gloeocapsa sp. BRSZ]
MTTDYTVTVEISIAHAVRLQELLKHKPYESFRSLVEVAIDARFGSLEQHYKAEARLEDEMKLAQQEEEEAYQDFLEDSEAYREIRENVQKVFGVTYPTSI